MPVLLFEIGTQEIPTKDVHDAKNALAEQVAEGLTDAQIEFGKIQRFATPRRITILIEEIAAKSRIRFAKRRGPPVSDAIDEEGNYTKAALAFAENNNIDVSSLRQEETEKGNYIVASIAQGSVNSQEVLSSLLKDVIEEIPASRKMRWATSEVSFIRPIEWFCAMLDNEIIDFECAGLKSSNLSYGHKFLAPEAISLTHAEDYIDTLSGQHVLADVEQRRSATWQAVQKMAQEHNLRSVYDKQLLDSVTNIIEYPFPILGSFDPSYLDLPEGVLITVMIHYQRYFPLRDNKGNLAPYFVSISNNKVEDESILKEGYEQVLKGRLYDALFFWKADRRKSLSQHAWGLSGIRFEKDLGTVADKVSRVSESALRLANFLELPEEDLALLQAALPIFRADLNTQMVFELPELEGVMAKAYALEEGIASEVADILEQGIRPRSSSSWLPTTKAAAILAVCDRLDTLLGFFAVGKRPRGSADPFGLRRDGIAVARILNDQGWSITLEEICSLASESYHENVLVDEEAQQKVIGFIWERVRSLLSEEDIRPALVSAAIEDSPAIIVAARRSHLLETLSKEEDFNDLLKLYKRAANITEEVEELPEVSAKRFETDYEHELYSAINESEDSLQRLFANVNQQLKPWDLGQGPINQLANLEEDLEAVITMKAPLDDFFDNVMVNVDNDKIRRNRLALLAKTREVLTELGELEMVEGIAQTVEATS